MKTYEILFHRLSNVQGFGVKYPETFPPSTYAGQLFVALGETLTDLDRMAEAKAVVSAQLRESVVARAAARDTLIDSLDQLNAAARVIEREMPGTQATFSIRRGASDPALVLMARRYQKDAKALHDAFVKYDVAPGFLQELVAATDQLAAAVKQHQDARRSRASLSVSIQSGMDKALDAVRQLDDLVTNKLRKDESALAEWEAARRLLRARAVASAEPKPQTEAASPPPLTAVAAA